MSDRHKKIKVVEGFLAVKAAERARKDPQAAAPKSRPESVAPAARAPAAEKRAARFGHTALPTRYEITCYECGFEFQLTGRTQGTYCPKCRKLIELVDYTIESEWSETLKTAGKIILAPSGVLKAGALLGVDVTVSGRVETGTIQAYRCLELAPGAVFEEGSLSGKDLKIAAGAEFNFKHKLDFRNVEVAGMLKAKLRVSGLVTVKTGGFLQGEVVGGRLCVEEGGGLKARVRVQAEAAAEEEDKLQKSA